MTALPELTERQIREKEYYNQYAVSFDLNRQIDFSPVTTQEKRPWNSYWAVYHLAAEYYSPNALMLDFGSGPGDNAMRFAKIGYKVEGFDISDSNVQVSKLVFEKHGYADKGNFQVAPAEVLPYPDNHFDFIAGVDILHHVDIARSINETRRVLKPGGVAVFREPLEVPLLDFIRNTWLVKLFAPKTKSFELHITEDERKLNNKDIVIIKEIFPNMVLKRYFLFARFDKFFREGSDPQPSVLEKIDFFLMKKIPVLKYLGGVVIFVLKKD
ncbi:MAG: class I SAM-dependent methyltransferase [Bdellovibrionales bacterium]|nr:class I SAM-dependent methyltransferase [Bdellovibrionales bacterium]